MKKGFSTRQRIIGKAVQSASLGGIEALTIGTLARQLDMSKSGLFAHFGSREQLQLAAVDEIVERFKVVVIEPALALPPGRVQLRAMIEAWIAWSVAPEQPGGCPLAAAAFEFDAQPGEVRERIDAAFAGWRDLLRRTIQKGKAYDIPEACDADRMVFDVFGLYFAHHVYRWLLGSPKSGTLVQAQIERILGALNADMS